MRNFLVYNKRDLKSLFFHIFIYYIYLPLYIHVARDTATDAAVVGHYKGGCTCVFNGAELLN